MKEALKVGQEMLLANLNATGVLQPSVGALDFRTFAFASQTARVSKIAVWAVVAVASVQLRLVLIRLFAQSTGDVPAVDDHLPKPPARTSTVRAQDPHSAMGAFRRQYAEFCADANCGRQVRRGRAPFVVRSGRWSSHWACEETGSDWIGTLERPSARCPTRPENWSLPP